jgi:hypothetical protein
MTVSARGRRKSGDGTTQTSCSPLEPALAPLLFGWSAERRDDDEDEDDDGDEDGDGDGESLPELGGAGYGPRDRVLGGEGGAGGRCVARRRPSLSLGEGEGEGGGGGRGAAAAAAAEAEAA